MNKAYLFIVLSVFILTACDFHYTFDERKTIPLSKHDFATSQGYKLDYAVYMPNSFTGWTAKTNNQLHYNPKSQSYEIKNLFIGEQQVDSWGARFKVASADWNHEFAFAKAHDTPEQSKFGIKKQGTVVQLKHIFYASDMYFELPINSQANYLHAEFKVTRLAEHPDALLFIYFSPSPI